MKMILLAFLLSFQSLSFADILVLNFNRNNSTVAAAKRAATERGERVIEIPRGRELDAESLRGYLNEIESQNIDISSMVFSGHDGGGEFSGEDGSLGKYELAEVMQDFPRISESTRSLVLRGCYTATPYEVFATDEESWRGIFPNINMIAGYVDGAPSSEREESKSFVEEILSLESEMYIESSVENITEMFEDISNSRWTTNALAIRTCFEDDFRFVERSLVAQGIGALSEQEISDLCNQEEISAQLEVVSAYYYAQSEEHANPPLEKRGTDLRDAYSYLQRNNHCMILMDQYMKPSLGAQIRLIYFDYIKSNFMDQFQDDMTDLEESIRWYNSISDDDISLPIDIESMTRAEINSLIHRLTGLTYADYIGVDQPTFGLQYRDDPRMEDLVRVTSIMEQVLFNLDEEIVPFDWVSSKHSPERANPYESSSVRESYGFNVEFLADTEQERLEEARGLGLHYGGLTYYLANRNSQDDLAPLAEDIMYELTANYNWTGSFESFESSASFPAQQVSGFLEANIEQSPRDVLRVAIRNPQLVSESVVQRTIEYMSNQNITLGPSDIEFYQNSNLQSYSDDEEILSRQRSYLERILRGVSPENLEEHKSMFD